MQASWLQGSDPACECLGKQALVVQSESTPAEESSPCEPLVPRSVLRVVTGKTRASLMAALFGWFVREFVPGGEGTVQKIRAWVKRNGYWFVLSGQLHLIGLLIVAIVASRLTVGTPPPPSDAPMFEAADTSYLEDDTGVYRLGIAPLEPTVLNTETLTQLEPLAQIAKHYDESQVFEEAGGGAAHQGIGLDLKDIAGFGTNHGPGPSGRGGTGVTPGLGQGFGAGGIEDGYGGRGAGHREAMLGAFGGTKASERAVAAALNWLYRHQNTNGSWSLQHTRRCRGSRCSGIGSVHADAAATAMGLLPYLAAGQTHRDKGPYQQTINRAVLWMLKQQKPDGDLSGGAPQPMYAHGLATIALCEAYGLSRDESLRGAAQKAVRFIEQAQNQQTGGWRYHPGDTGDTSVVGWQVMALESAQMAHLEVDTRALANVDRWLKSVAKGDEGGLYAYLPHREATPTTTAIGLLCRQYLGTSRDAPAMQEGVRYLLQNLPNRDADRNSYYWYYGTLVMHNLLGSEWDTWNRRMRRVLIESQAKEDCVMGSWDPEVPSVDAWGSQGGRLMTTAFATLSLEVYYRYLPLFQTGQSSANVAANGKP
jgi:Prenyltransferase and squalene oxidase repeat